MAKKKDALQQLIEEKANIDTAFDEDLGDDTYIKVLCMSLHDELEAIKSGCDSTKVLYSLLSSVDSYFESLAIEKGTPLYHHVAKQYQLLKSYTSHVVLGKKYKTYENSMAIGKMVKDLIYFGLPRIVAIRHVAKWHKLGQSTVRTCNERYNLEYPRINTKWSLLISPYNDLIRYWFSTKTDFPQEHKNAREALEKYRLALDWDVFEEIKHLEHKKLKSHNT